MNTIMGHTHFLLGFIVNITLKKKLNVSGSKYKKRNYYNQKKMRFS